MASNVILRTVELIVLLNIIAAVITVFREKRDISSIWAWLLVLIFFPVVGFMIYFILGRKLSNKHIFNLQAQEAMGIDRIAEHQAALLSANDGRSEAEAFIRLFLKNDEAIFTQANAVKIFDDGYEKFTALLFDIANAKHHINVEYFTIYDDEIGNQIINALTQSAARGVRVRVIYDMWGSHGRHKRLFKPLKDAGGQVEAFLMPWWQPFTFRINNRMHRKLVIIDGNIGYVGGFNIGDQYVGKFKKFGYWRDTHLRIAGDAVLAMQSRFFLDWNATTRKAKIDFADEYFPSPVVQGNVAMQIVSSGPDSEVKQIYQGYLQLFARAKESITIQTPYFIPKQAMLELLQLAAMAGVKVRLMIPNRPDHVFVYRATQYFARELMLAGGEVYTYEGGFLHAKVVVVDGKFASVGTANMDIRSFDLNFEVNAFMYDQTIAQDLEAQFENDLKQAKRVTEATYAAQSHWLTFKQMFSRLLAPIL
ncbi:cardiolipin synthase [Weissella oryzae SG25]|uniref:Cardiolipin synthase n=1 Tax=Weissella oryzae (strain DSM 25784 / JCM 18191 / LMG 30913 / SG25) TaxID=1329250 RepID=A0A069CZH3_WEIOS|nr:cardiolipin synthase [Weissella oryzae]GAK30491.1 cardiolipin synthase [Weissella oryzae SG25]